MPLRRASQFGVLVQRRLDMGVAALVRGLAIAVCGVAGIGFLLAALQMTLASRLGPIPATAIIGALLLMAAALAAFWRRPEAAPPPITIVPKEPTETEPPPLSMLVFVVGYVAAKALMRRWDKRS